MTRAKLRTARTDHRSQAGLSLLDEIDASTRGFCAILSRDLVAQERRRSLHKGGQQSHVAALGGHILVNAGQAE